MAFFVNLIALSWKSGTYQVHSQITASVDIWQLDQKSMMLDVSENSSYLDEMTVLARGAFPQYLVDRGHSSYASARNWYQSLPEEVSFILIHRGEWESALGD